MYSFTEILTNDTGFKGLISQGKKAARSSSSVLVYGESGVGKELLFKASTRIRAAVKNHSLRKIVLPCQNIYWNLSYSVPLKEVTLVPWNARDCLN